MKLALAVLGAIGALATPALAQHGEHDHGEPATAAAPAEGSVQGTGVVKSVNAKAGTITLHHGPIAALKWPAMTMTFKAAPEVLKSAKSGKTVSFTLNGAGDQVTAIH